MACRVSILANSGPMTHMRAHHSLEPVLTWYESANGRCRDEIFGDIFLFAFATCRVRSHGDFPTHNAEQAFLSGIEHAGSGISGGRDVLDHRGKSLLNVSGKQ